MKNEKYKNTQEKSEKTNVDMTLCNNLFMREREKHYKFFIKSRRFSLISPNGSVTSLFQPHSFEPD